MNKIIKNISFMLVLILLLLILVFIFDPMGLRTQIVSSAVNALFGLNIEKEQEPASSETNGTDQNQAASTTIENNKHPLLNAEQEAALENFGVDVDKLPTELSPSVEACLLEKLGSERAQEIISGDTPSAMEILKAGTCLGN